MMTVDVLRWWVFLCAVSAINVVAWSLAANALERRSSELAREVLDVRRLQVLLAAGYVLGCAFRSVFPVYDVPRLCLFDSWLCSVLLGRSVATVAELCFAAQWALLLREYARHAGSRVASCAAVAAVPLIVVAEVFSWYSVLTTSNLGHVVEEFLWGSCAALIAGSLIALWPHASRSLRPLLLVWGLGSLGYVAYMFGVDVPMYWSRWMADEEQGRAYLGIAQGLSDVAQRWVVSHRWEDWQSELVWMSLYFSVGVWVSISLIQAPPFKRNAPTQRGAFPVLTA